MPVHPGSFHDPNIIYVGEPTTLPANAAPPVDVYVADLSEDNAFRIAANTGVKTPIPGASYAFALASDRSGNVSSQNRQPWGDQTTGRWRTGNDPGPWTCAALRRGRRLGRQRVHGRQNP